MTVTAPPRPPRPSDPVDREELEALVEALFEEARQRARRRRRIYAASATLVALVAVAVSAVVERATQPDTASPALAARTGGRPHRRREDRLHQPPRPRPASGGLFVVNADGSGRQADPHRVGHAQLVIRRAEARLRGAVRGRGSVSVMSVDGSARGCWHARQLLLHGRRMGEGSPSCVSPAGGAGTSTS